MFKFFSKKTKSVNQTNTVNSIFFQNKNANVVSFEELEESLIMADVGVNVAQKIIKELKNTKTDNRALQLEEIIYQKLKPLEQPLEIIDKKPYFVLVVGVNGVGKTTAIAKIANYYKNKNLKVMLAAGDTFRAGAVEQLNHWAQKIGVNIISQQQFADSASVIYDALSSAKSHKYDVLLADTAGRMQSKTGLMDELVKIKRVSEKIDNKGIDEILLVVDANSGLNSVTQFTEFNSKVGISGLVINKLDSTAKGGIALAISEYNIPIRFIGTGETLESLKPFNAREYASALANTQSISHD